MKIFFGLGNPGEKYHLTRHNIGFLFVEFMNVLFDKEDNNFLYKKKLLAEESLIEAEETYLLIKPQTSMNETGRSAQKIIDFYKLDPAKDFILIHDDLDFEFGKFKIVKGKGPHVHNGVNSVASYLKTENFLRLRLGIANSFLQNIKNNGGSVADEFVLKNFSRQEQDQLVKIFGSALPDLKTVI